MQIRIDPIIVFLIGIIPILIFLGFVGAKKIRQKSYCTVFLIFAAIYCLIGVFLRSDSYQLPNINGADSFFSPLAYLLSYLLLRKVYLRVYKIEPTYYRTSWYDPNEGREQNWFDLLVYVTPIFIALLVPLIIGFFN